MNNIYGIQKMPETKMRDGKSIAKNTGMTTATTFGEGMASHGNYKRAAIEAGIAGTMAFAQDKLGQNKEYQQKKAEDRHNKYVDDLADVDIAQDRQVAGIGEKGFNRYDGMANIEGGELVTDKNHNTVYDAKGDPSHENRGKNIELDGHNVIPKDKRTAWLNAVKEFKMGSGKQVTRAKAKLDSIVSNLPKKAEKFQHPDGSVTKADGVPMAGKGLKGVPMYEDGLNGGGDVNSWLMKNNFTSEAEMREAARRDGRDPNKIQDFLDANSNNTGSRNAQDGFNNLGGKAFSSYQNFRKVDEPTVAPIPMDTQRSNSPLDGVNTISDQELFGGVDARDARTGEIVTNTSPGDYKASTEYKDVNGRYNTAKVSEPAAGKEGFDWQGAIGKVGTAASAINNLITGYGEDDKVARNYYTPEEQKYKDRSDPSRKAAMEASRAGKLMTRGKGTTFGQQEGSSRAYAGQEMKQMEKINNYENQRFDQVQAQNTQSRNQAQMTNLQLTNKYNEQDAQNKAAGKRYVDQGWSDVSTMSQYGLQASNLAKRNAKQDKLDAETVRMLGTGDMYYDDQKVLRYRGGSKVDTKRGRGAARYTA